MGKTTIQRPVLLLDRDGYAINLQLVGPYTAWVLIHKNAYGSVEFVAEGYRMNFDKAHADAYDAFLTHSGWPTPERTGQRR